MILRFKETHRPEKTSPRNWISFRKCHIYETAIFKYTYYQSFKTNQMTYFKFKSFRRCWAIFLNLLKPPIHPSKSNKANFAIDWLCSNSTFNLSSWELFKHQTNPTLRWAFEWFGETWVQSNNWWKWHWNIFTKVCR